MPCSAIFPAVVLHAWLSVVNSFRSASVPCTLGSSLICKAPGPQVGKLHIDAKIFPPVACRADIAALRAGSRAGSGFFMCENILGIRCSREVMISLWIDVRYVFVEPCRDSLHTLIRRDLQTAPRLKERMVPPNPSSPSSVLDQVGPRHCKYYRGNFRHMRTHAEIVEVHFSIVGDNTNLRALRHSSRCCILFGSIWSAV